MAKGSLSYQKICEMIESGFIKGADCKNANPASLDLTVSSEIYRLDGIFQPKFGEKISDLLLHINSSPYNLENRLERDVTYLAKLNEFMSLPEGVYGYCNPKSSTGRNDVHVRVLADGVPRYDAVSPAGYKGDLWVAILSKSFPIKISAGEKLSQIRFFNQDTRFDEIDLQMCFERDKPIWHHDRPLKYGDIKIRDGDGSIILTLDTASDMAGYECRGSSAVLDFSKINFHKPDDFFEPIVKRNNYIQLRKGSFYVLSTAEAVRIPPHLAAEMTPMDERSGDFRSHYAGYLDPGWGWGENGEGAGRQVTLEVRPFEDLLVRNHQPIAKIKLERMSEIPHVLYDSIGTSHYVGQVGPRLSKHFKIE